MVFYKHRQKLLIYSTSLSKLEQLGASMSESPLAPNRPTGFYWVVGPDPAELEIARWNARWEVWNIVGVEGGLDNTEMTVLAGPIAAPLLRYPAPTLRYQKPE
jgi:hypothetical protein